MSLEQLKDRVGKFQEILKEFPEIRYLGDPILRTQTQEVEYEEGLKIGKGLGKVLVRYRKITGIGRGLASPQIGINKSVFVTYLDDQIQIYINPKIVKASSITNLYRELCLSSGIMWADVERPENVKMEWTDETGKKQIKIFSEFQARLIQHEESHLRGVCNLDQAVPGTIEIQLNDPLQEKLRDK